MQVRSACSPELSYSIPAVKPSGRDRNEVKQANVGKLY